jgi:putative Holliday junction resolvase
VGGAAAATAGALAAALRANLEVPVELHDERLTTVEAERALREAGHGDRERRRRVDAAAAAVVLEGWLRANRR